jgi:phosphoribosylglycinamide formyltransferase-1
MRKIAIFASGSGTNAENIIKYFSTKDSGQVTLVLSNKREAFVFKRAASCHVKSVFFEHNDFYGSQKVLNILLENKIDMVVLAGFLLLVPEDIIDRFRGKIINIHPALLPKYGGKGMYGDRVHKAVIMNHETESGITIHHVNRNFDEGDIIFQAKCPVLPDDTPETLAERVHSLEYAYFPGVIEKELRGH